ncbi:MAG: hypothetical protein LBL69_00715 [Zoogloeaceae bacterium]|jgi:hypothetical protein|nr:hypothetical protein [Zoogloeaceae bacterium]
MRIVTAEERKDWLAAGKVLEEDNRGPKVLALPCGDFLKVFHTRQDWLRRRLFPYAERFARHAARLKALGIAAPQIAEIFWWKKKKRISACRYRPVPGRTLEALFRENPAAIEALIPALAAFIARLHAAKIFFRSLHPGNIVLLPEAAQGDFGLIDVLDLKFCWLPLGRWRIERNFRHFEHGITDRQGMQDFPLAALKAAYAQCRP